ncbi:MAG: DUF3990 domain-containing protein [Planctomycetaceae bacterium]|jgi:hypothetical protein|nr:DUF3990 domain-containing protein [Planctomycetaceae bacterium]
MKLYHGGILAVETPQLQTRMNMSRTTDFGNGFYTTTNREQAEHWAKIKRIRYQTDIGVVSFYETDDRLFNDKSLKCLVFKSANKKWLNFVMQNRQQISFFHEYDIVSGPVANDRIYATLTLFESELLDLTETLRRLKSYKLVDQILFHTEKSLSKLTYIGSEAIS